MMELQLYFVFGLLLTYFIHEMFALGDDIQKHGRKKR